MLAASGKSFDIGAAKTFECWEFEALRLRFNSSRHTPCAVCHPKTSGFCSHGIRSEPATVPTTFY